MLDLEKFVSGLHDYIGKALRPLADRIKALEDREPVPGRQGEKGATGEPGPAGADGAAGVAGAPGERGEKGDVGEKGERGEPGPIGPAGDRGEKGDPGRDGRDGLPGVPGQPGEKGEKGIDGTNGRDGRDGVDGLGFDDLQVEHDGERGFAIVFAQGDRVKRFEFSVPVVLDRGFYRHGMKAEAGDGVTFGGSYWIAQKATETKPEIGNADWRLAVKKGRDGKDGERGEKGDRGDRGLPGSNGRDLR